MDAPRDFLIFYFLIFYFFSERAARGGGGGGGAARLFLFLFFPVQQTTSGIGHRGFFRVGNQCAECEKQQQQLLTTLRPSKGGLKRQSLLQTWCGSAPRRGPSANGYDAWRLDPADPGARSLQLLLQTWCGSAPRRGPSANGYDAWRFGSGEPGRKILAAAAADLAWVCAPPRTIRKWLRRLAFWILRTRAQDPCSCCCRPGVGLRPAADHPQMVTTPGVLDPVDPGARSLQLLLQT